MDLNSKKAIELDHFEACALGEVLEFILEDLEEGVDDRYPMIERILDQVDSLDWRG